MQYIGKHIKMAVLVNLKIVAKSLCSYSDVRRCIADLGDVWD